MKHKELVKQIQGATGIEAGRVEAMTEALAKAVSALLMEGDSLSVQGFGSFELKKKEERLSVNPKTGQRYMVPPKMVPVFRPAPTLKDRIRQNGGHE